MNIKSPKLREYLANKGFLNDQNDDLEGVLKAKRDFIRENKKQWKRQSQPLKELRPSFTIEQMISLKTSASKQGLKPTSYVKRLALEAIGVPQAPNKEVLIQALQNLTRVVTDPNTTFNPLLIEAEKLLKEYVNSH